MQKMILKVTYNFIDAYITTSFDAGGTFFLMLTVGRYVTSWGEATFIPVGANGLVTNALDLI